MLYHKTMLDFNDIGLHRLQSVQNAAARLITGVRCCDHIMPALRQLHWLPVRRRVQFKISTLIYCSLAGTAPVYPADDCSLVAIHCSLLTVEHVWSRGPAISSVTAVLPLLCQLSGTDCLNSCGNRISPSDISCDRLRHLFG